MTVANRVDPDSLLALHAAEVDSWDKEGNRHAGDPLHSTDTAETLGASTLHADRCTNGGRKIRLHVLALWRNFRPFTNDVDVHVGHRPPGIAHQFDDLTQEQHRIGTLPLRIGIREESTDVSQTGSAEERIAHRVRDGVGITVAEQSTFARERHAGQHQRTLVVGESMNVESLTDSHR